MRTILITLLLAGTLAAQTATVTARQGLLERIWEFLLRVRSTVTYSLTSGETDANGFAVLDLSISTSRLSPAGLQWDMNYDPVSIESLSVAEGPVSTAAGKTVSCSTPAPNTMRCLIAGLNINTIANGVAARVTVRTILDSPAASTTIAMSGLVTVSRFAQPLNSALAPGGGVVTMRAYLSSLSCGQAEIEPGEEASCIVSLNRKANADTVIALEYATGLTGPPSVTIPAGQQSTTVTVRGI